MKKYQLDSRGGACSSLFAVIGGALAYQKFGLTNTTYLILAGLVAFALLSLTGRRWLWVDAEKGYISIVYCTLFKLPYSKTGFQLSDFTTVVLETCINQKVSRKQGTTRRAWYHEVELSGERRAYLTRFDELGRAVAFCTDLAQTLGLEFKETVKK